MPSAVVSTAVVSTAAAPRPLTPPPLTPPPTAPPPTAPPPTHHSRRHRGRRRRGRRRHGSRHRHRRGLAGAYRDEALVTALLPDGHGGRAAVSSSTQPSLMVGMLDALDLRRSPPGAGDRDGHRLQRRPDVPRARRRRRALRRRRPGARRHRPRPARRPRPPSASSPQATAAAGLPSHAPYDRIIATCAFPAVPWAWAEQLVPGGLLLVDVKVGLLAGNLALLRRTPDRLEGRLLAAWAGFMAVRDRDRPPVWQEADPPVGPRRGRDGDGARPAPALRVVALVPGPDRAAAGGHFPPVRTPPRGRAGSSPPTARGARSARPTAAAAELVTWGGPRRLWDDVERAHALWRAHRRPGWDRIGLTVTPDRIHTVWLDRPDAPLAT